MTTPAFNNAKLGNTVRTEHPAFYVNQSGIIFSDGSQQLTAFTGTANETDPVFSSSVAYNITISDTGNWTEAYSWGDHSLAGYATTGQLSSVSGYLQNQIDNITDIDTFTTGVVFNTSDKSLVLTRDGGSVTGDLSAVAISGDNISIFVNDQNYLISGTSYHPNISSAISSDNIGRTYIQDILLDSNGHVTGLTTASETVINTDTYATGVVFNAGDGDLILTLNDNTSVTGNLDGRYLQSETDPIFTGSPAYSITGGDITNWNTAYGWGDHGTQGYLIPSLTAPVNVNQVLAYNGAGNWENKTFDISLIEKGTIPFGGYPSSKMGYYYSWNINSEAVINDGGNDINFRVESVSDTHLFYVDGSTNSRVGIGTASPAVKLDVNGVINSTFASNNKFVVKTNNIVAKIQPYDPDSATYIGNETNHKLVFRTNNSDRVIITNGGDVGIGTASPSQKLDIRYPAGGGMALIKDSDSNDGLRLGDIYGNSTAYQGLSHASFASAGSYMIMSEGTNTLISADTGGTVFIRGGPNYSYNEVRVYPDSKGVVVNEQGYTSDFRVEGDADTHLLYVKGSAGTDRVGINTSDPQEKLSVTSLQADIAGFHGNAMGPVASGDLQSLVIKNSADSLITEHYENTDNTSTKVLKNLIRYGADFVSIDDAYDAGLGITFYPKFKVNTNTGAITFNDQFTFPTTDGSAGQSLVTDGSGALTWQDQQGAASSSNYIYSLIFR